MWCVIWLLPVVRAVAMPLDSGESRILPGGNLGEYASLLSTNQGWHTQNVENVVPDLGHWSLLQPSARREGQNSQPVGHVVIALVTTFWCMSSAIAKLILRMMPLASVLGFGTLLYLIEEQL